MSGEARRAFVPIAGLHHAGRGHAAGFCVFNDCGVVIELLAFTARARACCVCRYRRASRRRRFYAFEDDPGVWLADIHEDGRVLYPGPATPMKPAGARRPAPS